MSFIRERKLLGMGNPWLSVRTVGCVSCVVLGRIMEQKPGGREKKGETRSKCVWRRGFPILPSQRAHATLSCKYIDAAAEFGRNPLSKHQIQSEYGDEQADAGRDCRTRLARPNSQARTGTGEY